ncbi:PaaI family thioesterase [Aeromicrobium fastidiosum]|uniref:PaaI family thioesterase n=1 Tax=Aeromicrobium fastidiosum TaxID=52699 RepID=A0A641AS55_9ACTN|nr:PaaI family thioesterase [Aeromicrobium fastidiosum]KAA1379881.1 PaaI family thioesterase [Aeromicrobium fastidiosum]MBP2389385.1 acyl-coenzyme A thioesterase PaaI-like protein [Aeromicrobium fastidiosum]
MSSVREPVVLTAEPRGEGLDVAVAAARRVVEALLLAGDGTALDMSDVAARLEAVAERLERHAPTLQQRMVDMWAGDGVTRHDPVVGSENALAPPLRFLGRDDGSVESRTTLGLPYQGPPGVIHGGISALLLDHALDFANQWAGVSGMTGTLTVRYHRPAPLFVELVITARQETVEGRKIRTTGELHADGELCVTAEAIFIDKHLPRPR